MQTRMHSFVQAVYNIFNPTCTMNRSLVKCVLMATSIFTHTLELPPHPPPCGKPARLKRQMKVFITYRSQMVFCFTKGGGQVLAFLSKVVCELDQFLQVVLTDGGLLRAHSHQHVALWWKHNKRYDSRFS